MKGGDTMKEHEIQKVIVQTMRANGYFTINTDVFFGLRFLGNNMTKRSSFINQMMSLLAIPGTQDMICLIKDEVLFVELKNDRGKLSSIQKEVIATLTEMGFNVQVWRSLDDCLAFLEWKRAA